jgi:hypothetical protein
MTNNFLLITLQCKFMLSHSKHSTIAVHSSSAINTQIPRDLIYQLQQPNRSFRFPVPVITDAMEPGIPNRSIVHLEQIGDQSEIEQGQVYFIVCHSLKGHLCRVSSQPHEDYLRVTFDNLDKSAYPAQLVPIASIWAVLKVVK